MKKLLLGCAAVAMLCGCAGDPKPTPAPAIVYTPAPQQTPPPVVYAPPPPPVYYYAPPPPTYYGPSVIIGPGYGYGYRRWR